MCLIIASQEGKLPEWEYVQNGYKDNPHSWGIMRSNGKRVSVQRGLNFASFNRAYDKLRGDPYVIHFRWATHGAVDISNCHPFEVSPGLFMAHNGIIATVAQTNKARSDTWHYARHLRAWGLREDNVGFPENIAAIEKCIGAHNKLAFLNRAGSIHIANEKQGERVGTVWFSNDYSFPHNVIFPRRWHTKVSDSAPLFGKCDSCYLPDELTEYDVNTFLCETCYSWWIKEELLELGADDPQRSRVCAAGGH